MIGRKRHAAAGNWIVFGILAVGALLHVRESRRGKSEKPNPQPNRGKHWTDIEKVAVAMKQGPAPVPPAHVDLADQKKHDAEILAYMDRQKRASEKRADPGNRDQQQAEQPSSVARRSATDPTEPHSPMKCGHKDRQQNSWTNNTAIIVAVIAAAISGYQAFLARQAFVAATRAWLSPVDFGIAIKDDGTGGGISGNTKNVGREPALRVLFAPPDAGFLPIPPILDPRGYAIPTGDMCADYQNWFGKSRNIVGTTHNQSVIFPDQELSFQVSLNPDVFDYPRGVEAINQHRAIFYFRSCVSYQTLGEMHFTAFCFYLISDPVTGTPKTHRCPSGNDAD